MSDIHDLSKKLIRQIMTLVGLVMCQFKEHYKLFGMIATIDRPTFIKAPLSNILEDLVILYRWMLFGMIVIYIFLSDTFSGCNTLSE